MLRGGNITPNAARAILNGGVSVFVRIYGRGSRGDYITVTVAR